MRKNRLVKLLLSFVLIVSMFSMLGTGTASAAQAFIKPATGITPTGGNFGDYRSHGSHNGLDISNNDVNSPIKASASGTVTTSGVNSYWGEYIILSHSIAGKSYKTIYAHMKTGSRKVFYGNTVVQGQLLGYMGSTGDSTGQHLHFELHVGTTPVNPLPYIDGTINPQPITYHTYDSTWAVVEIVSPTGGSKANLFANVGSGIIGTLPVGGVYKVYGQKEYTDTGVLYYDVGPGYIHNAYGVINNHHAVVSSSITTYNSPNGTVNRTLAAGTYSTHGAKDGWYNLGASTWVRDSQIKVIKNP